MTVGTKGAFVTVLHPGGKQGGVQWKGLGAGGTDGEYEIMLG